MVMMKSLTLIGAALTIAVLTPSCARFRSDHYVGERQPISSNTVTENSVWQLGDEVYHVRVVDSNTLVAASAKWDSTSRTHTLTSYPLVCSTLGGHNFLNVWDENHYTILRMIASGSESEVVLLTIDADKVNKDIAEGKLKARRDGHDFLASCSKEELDRYVLENLPSLFSLDGAGVARLLSGKLKP
jgi:hypothetical protein